MQRGCHKSDVTRVESSEDLVNHVTISKRVGKNWGTKTKNRTVRPELFYTGQDCCS